MSIQILDCTLRDGGYINDWRFGKKTIISILDKLEKANIDIIECGFLTRMVQELSLIHICRSALYHPANSGGYGADTDASFPLQRYRCKSGRGADA